MYFVHPQLKINNLKKVNLSERLSAYFPEKRFVFTDMGRSAFKAIVEKLNLQNSEILFPAYICDIFYPIFKQYNIKPVFLDVDLSTFNIKTEEIAKKITSKTKAILICHTYGLPFDVDALRSNFLGRSDLKIIEDCAHSFGADTGRRGDVAFFSLYKQFPALRGGMLACPKDWQIVLPKTSFNFRDFISLLNCFSLFAFIFKKIGKDIAPKMLRKEKMLRPAGINALSLKLFSYSLADFAKSLDKRKKLALLFQAEMKKIGFDIQESNGNVFCYLSALVPKNLRDKRDEIVQKLRKHRVFCNRIWHTPIILNQEAQKECGINLAEFPNTIEAAKRIINFPLQNHYSEKDVKKITEAVKKVISDL